MKTRIIIGTAIILFGLGFLIDFPFFNTFMALLLIYLGVRFITGKNQSPSFARKEKLQSMDDRLNSVNIFSSSKLVNASQDFSGGEFVTVFAESELDLREAASHKARINLNLVAVFGNLKVLIPSDWAVNTDGVGVLGTFSNRTAQPAKPTSSLAIEGAAVFGVVEISN